MEGVYCKVENFSRINQPLKYIKETKNKAKFYPPRLMPHETECGKHS